MNMNDIFIYLVIWKIQIVERKKIAFTKNQQLLFFNELRIGICF